MGGGSDKGVPETWEICQSGGQLRAGAAEGSPSRGGDTVRDLLGGEPSLVVQCREGGRKNKGEEPIVQPLEQQHPGSANTNPSWKSKCCFLNRNI